MHQAIYNKLVFLAKAGTYTTYGAISPLAGLDMSNPDHRNQMTDILCEIARFEHAQGRPMLTVVVVHEQDNMPGKRFFILAKEFGLQTSQNNLTFFARELTRVHEFWKHF